MGETITTRVPDELAKDIDFFTELEKLDRSTEVRRLLNLAIKQRKQEYALERYKRKEVSIGKASHLADMPIADFMLLLRDRKVPFNYGDIEEDIKAAKRIAQK